MMRDSSGALGVLTTHIALLFGVYVALMYAIDYTSRAETLCAYVMSVFFLLSLVSHWRARVADPGGLSQDCCHLLRK